MPADPYIPRADEAFRRMAENFATNIHRDPARYGLTPAEAESIMRQYSQFSDALARASNELTRAKGTIAAKDDARSIIQTTISNFSAYIRSNLGIDDSDKINIGVRPRNIARGQRNCPQTPPLLQFIGSLPGIDELRYHDSNRPTSPGKPYGAERLELWVAYTAPGLNEPKLTKADARLVGTFRKSRMLVERDTEQDARGAKPTYWARWGGFDGEVGPWSLPCSMAIAAAKAKEDVVKKKTKAAESPEEADPSLKLAA